jgi:ligand-binding sensor domain-containing protein/signal transduction histidine kinase
MNRGGFHIPTLILLLVGFLLLPSPAGRTALALDPTKTITQYTHDVWQTENGLPQSTIRAIAQTRDGYIWLGTEEGLVRFDGVKFTVFDKGNTKGLTNNYAWAITEDHQGSLWIGTGGGGLLRLRDGVFTALTTGDGLSSDIVRCIYVDGEGSLWIGTGDGGLDRYKDGRFTTYTSKQGLSNDTVYCLCEDREGGLWIGTGRGLNRFKNGALTVYTTKDGLTNDIVRSLYQDRKGNLWIGTAGGGLNRFRDGRFTAYTTKQGLSNNHVLAIYEDGDGNLWLGTDSGGLNRFRDGRFTTYTSKQGLSNDTVLSIYEDREGSLWIGTGNGGLNRLKDGSLTTYTMSQGLSYDVVRTIYEDQMGSLWIGTYGGGLTQMRNGKSVIYTTKQGLSNNIVLSVYGDEKGNIWVGTSGGGLNRLRQGKVTVYTTKQGLSHDVVRAIYEDHEGNLWIGTYGGGLNKFRDGKFTAFTMDDGLSSDTILSIFENSEGSLWIGTFGGGLNHLRNGRFTRYTTKEGLSNDTVLSIYGDREGALWIGTNGGGLDRFKDGRFAVYTTKDGLFNDVVQEILEDEAGNLWMSCNKGIFRVSKNMLDDFARGAIKSISCIAYGTADGMKSRECNGGNQPAGCKTRDGRLWFPTIKGVVVIDPKNMRTNKLPPPVVIEQAVIDRRPVDPQKRTELPPGKGELEFYYTGLSLLAPERVKFKYKLEGFDEDWRIPADSRRVADYTNIPPGEYRFRVIASNNDGVWNETGAVYEFYLSPHFYQTKLFFALGVVAVGLLGYALYLLRVKQLKARERELVSQVQERTKDLLEMTRSLEEANRLQADFVSGVSHELKTPLTLIRLYGETLLYGQDFSQEERRSYYQIITRESERLTHLIEKVLDFSRIDRDQKQYHLLEGDLSPVVTQTVEIYGQYLRRQGFTIRTALATGLPVISFDADAISAAILNLMENAAQYSSESKLIEVRLHLEDGRVIFEVEDHGIGIPAGEREKIFQQFYRVRNGMGKGGYGLGLFLVRHIMDAHGGRVELESEVGRGSKFRLIFPASASTTEMEPSSAHGALGGTVQER